MSSEATRYDDVLNELSDADGLWGALLFLRPERDQRLGAARMLLIAASFSFFYGMCANAVFAVCRHLGGRQPLPFYLAPAFLTLTSYVLGLLFFARAWNRRAHLLSRRIEWAEKNYRPKD
jgi:hypothetical protein